jgi:hypothetical protein
MNNFQASYEKILEVLRSVQKDENFLQQIRRPKLSDIELIAMNLTAEYLSLDSECQLFRVLPETFMGRIERSVYNRRKRKLFPFIEQIREKLSLRFNEFENYFIVDSMPLEVAKLSRSQRSRIYKEEYTSSPNKKYLSAEHQLDLFENYKIKLEVPMRNNQHGYKKQAYIFRKSRKRIETLFSQLCDQFLIRRNYAKSFEGFKTRIVSKITSLTMIQVINKFIFGRNENNIKINIA